MEQLLLLKLEVHLEWQFKSAGSNLELRISAAGRRATPAGESSRDGNASSESGSHV